MTKDMFVVVWRLDDMDPYVARVKDARWENYGKDGTWIRQVPHVLNYRDDPLQLHIYFPDPGEVQDWAGRGDLV